MRNLICTLLFSGFCFCASAQKVYFIYLQTDDYKPFYVKMNDKIYSSATSGYLILPNLVEGSYTFAIGFPSSATESKFIVPVSGKDRGFLVKNFESGLGLFDLQSLSIIRAQKQETDQGVSYQKRNDNFSSLLSKAANDTSLLYAIVKQDVAEQKPSAEIKTDAAVDEPKSKNEETVLIKDTAVQTPPQTDLALEMEKKDTNASAQIKEQPKNSIVDSAINRKPDMETTTKADIPQPDTSVVIHSETYRRSVVKKHSESSTSEGFGLVFYDTHDEGVDTIRLIIPNPRITFKQPGTDAAEKQNDFIQLSELKKDTATKVPVVVAKKTKVPVKSKCKSVASNNDFFKLRKNMAGEETDEGMVDEAKKYFRNKCFSTEQIKNLSALFLTSAGKYLFFDAAYLHVTDQENFSSLESEIKDDYYLRRFKALIGE